MQNLNNYLREYSYLVEYSPEDEAYLARCIELAVLS